MQINICGKAYVEFGDEQVGICTGLNSDGEGLMYLMPRIKENYNEQPMDIPDDAVNVYIRFKNTKSIDTFIKCLTDIKNEMEKNEKENNNA